MYFEKFPKIVYDGVSIPDISIRYKINTLVRDSVNTYELYRLSEGEKPEDVAYRVYGDVTFHWIILLMNDISDPLDEWFRTNEELELHLTNLYGVNIEAVHHYEDSEGYVIPEYIDTTTVTITNRQFTEKVNNDLKEIKVLRPQYLSQIINEFESTING